MAIRDKAIGHFLECCHLSRHRMSNRREEWEGRKVIKIKSVENNEKVLGRLGFQKAYKTVEHRRSKDFQLHASRGSRRVKVE